MSDEGGQLNRGILNVRQESPAGCADCPTRLDLNHALYHGAVQSRSEGLGDGGH